jgi:hypothetical protein
MRRSVASAALVGLLLAAPAHARTPPETAARALASDPVYVHPRAAARLTVVERGQVRLAIAREAIGRIKIAVVPEDVAERWGGVHQFANQVDGALDPRGTLIIVGGPAYWAVTSYPQSEQAAAALEAAVNDRPDDRLAAELVKAIRRIARVDPGPAGDLRRQQPGAGSDPDADEFLDDIGDAFKLGVLIVAAAIALPFLLGAVLLIVRARRRRAREEEVHEAGEQSADSELVALGDEIRSLDLDTSMPNASRAALAEYEQAIASYDQANDLLSGEPTEYRVQQARAAIAAGKRHIAATRERLG